MKARTRKESFEKASVHRIRLIYSSISSRRAFNANAIVFICYCSFQCQYSFKKCD